MGRVALPNHGGSHMLVLRDFQLRTLRYRLDCPTETVIRRQ